MTCPVCSGKTTVIDCAKDVDEVVRLRRCIECNHRFYTAERDIDYSEGYDVISRYRRSKKKLKKMQRGKVTL